MAANPLPNPPPKADIVPRLALRPKEAAKALGIGVRLLWSLTNSGRIPHLKLGRTVLYPVAELERLLAEETDAHGKRGEL